MAVPLRAEVRHSLMLTAVPVLAFLGGLAGWLGLLPGVATWDSTSLAIVSATQLLGPVAAGLACWIAQREQRRRMAYLRVLSERRAPAAPLFQLTAATLWAVAAYLAVCGALVVYTVVHGGVGRLSAGAIVVGCLGAAVHVAVGYLVGAVVRWRLAAPLVALGCYVAVVLNMDHAGQWFYLLSPVTVENPSVFVAWQRGVFAAQGWWLLAVLVVITALVSMTGRLTRVAVATGVVALLASVLAAQRVAAYDGHLFADGIPEVTRVCQGSAPTVCVHPAFRAAAGPLRQEFAPLVRRLANTPGRITLLQHRAAWDRSPLAPGMAPLYLDDLAPGYATRARDFLVEDFTHGEECDSRDGPESGWYAEIVSDWLLDRRPAFSWDDGGAQVRFSRATERQRQAWFVSHYEAYRTCALTAASFASLP